VLVVRTASVRVLLVRTMSVPTTVLVLVAVAVKVVVVNEHSLRTLRMPVCFYLLVSGPIQRVRMEN
jgi:hypothetical protein